MKKLAYLFLFLCLLFACKPTTPKNEDVKKAEPTPKPISIEAIPNGDTILLAPHQKSEAYWAKSDAKVDFSTTWLEKALAYKRDTLPVFLASYLHPLFRMKCMQEKLYFDISYHNTDEDPEDECILFFFNSCWVANDATTIVLEKDKGKWIIGLIARGQARHPLDDMRTTFDEKQKIIITKNGGWGMAMGWLNHHLYKKNNGKYQEVAKIDKAHDFSSGTACRFIGLTVRSQAKYQILVNEYITVTHYISVISEVSQNDFFLIKNRAFQETLRWDKMKQMYLAEDFTERQTAFYEHTSFYDSLEKELLHMAYYGTPEQQKHLDYYLIGRGLKR